MKHSICESVCEVDDVPSIDISSGEPAVIPLGVRCGDGIVLRPNMDWEIALTIAPDIVLDAKCTGCSDGDKHPQTVDREWVVDVFGPIVGTVGTVHWLPPNIPVDGIAPGVPFSLSAALNFKLLNWFIRTPLVQAGIPGFVSLTVVQGGKTMICLAFKVWIRWGGYDLEGSPCEAACELDATPSFFLEGGKEHLVSPTVTCRNDVFRPNAEWGVDITVDAFSLDSRSIDGSEPAQTVDRESFLDVSVPVLGKLFTVHWPPTDDAFAVGSSEWIGNPALNGEKLPWLYTPILRRILKRTPVLGTVKIRQDNETMACVKAEISVL